MHPTNDTTDSPAQAPSCDILTRAGLQAYKQLALHAMADKLSHAQHVLGIPELQKDFQAVRHPLLDIYRLACVGHQCARPVPDITFAEAAKARHQAMGDFQWYLDNSEDLRRQTESFARLAKANRDFFAIHQTKPPAEGRTRIVRRDPRRRRRS
jgi:hypothetical protein